MQSDVYLKSQLLRYKKTPLQPFPNFSMSHVARATQLVDEV